MNTFSIAVSKRLREIGVEEKTGLYFRWWHSPIEDYRTPTLINETQLKDLSDPILIPAYRLDDILRLMPKIGEKMEFGDIGSTFSYVWNETMSREPDSEDECIFENHKENRPPCEVYSHHLLDVFLSGDYPEAEKVLLDLLKEHE